MFNLENELVFVKHMKYKVKLFFHNKDQDTYIDLTFWQLLFIIKDVTLENETSQFSTYQLWWNL